MKEAEVLERISEGGSAYGLLIAADPNFDRRFTRMCRTMREFLRDVQQHFPDATYYTASGGFHLMLGNSHADDKTQTSQQQLVALGAIGVTIGDGDF